MKLNPECIRAIMLYLEENLTMNSDLEINEISVFDLPRKINFSIEEIANTLLVLDDAGFIVCYRNDGDDAIVALDVYRITYTGYQFLESVRSDTVWKKSPKNQWKCRFFFSECNIADCNFRSCSDGQRPIKSLMVFSTTKPMHSPISVFPGCLYWFFSL